MTAGLAGLRIDPEKLAQLEPAERERVAEELRVVEEAFKRNPLLGYRPHGKQVEFHSPPFPRTRLFIGGNRSGKTTATLVDTIIQAIDADLVPEHLKPFKRWEPPCYIRVVGPDLTRWLEGIALQKFREWCPRDQLHGGGFHRAWEKQQVMLRFKNGSWIQFMSNDQDLDKFAGAALHRIVYDESPRSDIYEECRMRLIDFGGEEMFGLTPMDGMSNWLYERYYSPWERGHLGPQSRLVLVDMDDNPHLSREDKEWALEGKTPEERDARKSGRFVSFSGLIYPEWSSGHIVPQPPELPYGVEVFCGIDPGYRHLCAVLYCYLDHEDDLVVFDEIAMPKTIISTICKEIQLRNERWGISPNWYVIDPAAQNKNAQTGRSDQQEFLDNGVSTLPGQNAVRPGINRVKERIAADKLHVAASCQELLSEFKKYRWVRDSSRSEDDAREKPVKRDDHCFVAGTVVSTAEGSRSIESVEPGDLVWTRQGLFPVALSGLTREDALTRVLELEDGRELCGTGNHPVYVSGRGWCSLDAVRYGDKMLVWVDEKKSPGTALPSTAIPTRSTLALAPTSVPLRCDFTGLSGSLTTGPSHRIITSITSTAMRPTMTSPTWNAYQRHSTSPSITGVLNAESTRVAGWQKSSALRPSHGTARQMDWRGTGSTQGACLETRSPSLTFATTAAMDSRVPSAVTCGSARTSARLLGDGQQAWMMSTVSANGAASTTAGTDMPRPRLVPLRVVANSPGPSAAVYNLTVLGPPEYFANGVLVHNCLDALRYVVMARPLAPSEDVPREHESQKARLLRHHLRRFHGKKHEAGFGPGQFV